MEELKVGIKFDTWLKHYKEIAKIVDQKPNKALVEFVTDEGRHGLCHMQFENGKWKPFITTQFECKAGDETAEAGVLYW